MGIVEAAHGLTSSMARRVSALPPGSRPAAPALQGGSVTTGPPGKSQSSLLDDSFLACVLKVVCCCLVAKSCPTLCDSKDGSLPGSSVPGISQVRILEWGAISSSRGYPDPGTEPASPALAGRFFITEPPGKPKDCAGILTWKMLCLFEIQI